MSDDKTEPAASDDAELEREIRSRRKFSLAEAIGRMGAGELMKGASPVTQKRQAVLKIEQYLEKHLVDAEGALEVVLLRRVAESEILLETNYEQPLAALAHFIEQVLSSTELLHRFVDEVDAQWGRIHYERPHLQKGGLPPDREDPYTFSSVRATLSRLSERLRGRGETGEKKRG